MSEKFGSSSVEGNSVRLAQANATTATEASNTGQETAATLAFAQLEQAARDPSTRVVLSGGGKLMLLTKDDREIFIDGADPLIAAFRAKPWILLQKLNDDRDTLVSVIEQSRNPESGSDTFGDLVETLTKDADAQSEKSQDWADGSADGRAVSGDATGLINGTVGSAAGNGSNQLGPLAEETAQFGRDDIKRGEVGSAGENPNVGTGQALGHLTGLGDEEPGLRNGEKISSTDNTRFVGETTGVGAGVDHLWLLGDFEYYRASTDHLSVDGILPDLGRSSPVYADLIEGPLAFRLLEDNLFCGELFSAKDALLPARDIRVTMDPAFGTITVKPDGTFKYTPLPGFSGKAEFDYSFTDPRTGEKIKGTADVTVEAVADPALISGAAVTPEDTLIATPVSVTLGDTDGSETICFVEITNVPPGATLGFSGPIAATITPLPGGGMSLTGDTADIQAALLLLTFDPPLHFSGQVTLDVTVKTIESNADPRVPGFNDTATVVHPYVIDVIPVADLPPVTGGNYTTDEDQRVALLGLDGSLVDTDGSEVLTFEIRGVDPDAKLENAGGTEYPFVLELDGTKTYSIPPAEIGAVFYNPPPNDHGTFDMTITAIATEQANLDQATNTAPIQVVITPVDDLPTISGSSSTDEDTAVNFGANINIGPVIDADGSESITRVAISGVPAGVTPTGTEFGGATIGFNPGTGIITVTGGTEQDIRDTVASLSLTPPLHSDVDIDLQVVVETTDAGVVAVSAPVTHTIAVAAVADAPVIGGIAIGTEDNPIDLPISSALVDQDGSETYDFAEVTMPAGINLILPPVLPNGIQVVKVGDVYTFTPGTATTAQFEDFLANNIQIQPPLDSDVDFSIGLKIGTIETTLSGGQVTQLRNESTATVPVIVRPVVDTPAINSSSTVNEDGILDPNQIDPPGGDGPAPIGTSIEAGIQLGETAVGDTSEELTQVVITGIPATATIAAGLVLNATIDQSVPGQITVTGVDEAAIRAALQTITLVPGPDEDADISLGVAVTIRDNDPDNPADNATQTFNGTHTVAVAAVADAPVIAGAASGTEDNPIDLVITSALGDTDGSETYDFAEVTMPAGINLILPPVLPNGILVTKVGDVYTFTPGTATTAQFENFLANDIQIDPPLDSDVDFPVGIRIGVIESTLSGGQVTLLRNESTTTVTVEVTPVVDTPAINSSSSVNEDGIVDPNQPQAPGNIAPVGFGTPLEAGITLGETAVGDTSEEITQIVITGIPAGSTIGAGTVPGATIDQTTPGQITITGTSETAIRDAVKTLTLIPGSHTDVDIPLGVAVTILDTDPDNAASNATQTFNGTHTIAVAAVADAPVISGSASGTEDNPIDLVITSALVDQDGSETYDFAEVTMPAGINLILPPVLPNGILVAKVGDVYTFTPGTATTAQFENFLANDIQIDPPLDSDVDFPVGIRIGTIESTLSGGQVALLRNESTTTVTVEVTPVVDTPAINSTSSVNEDGIVDPNLPQTPGNIAALGFGTPLEAGITLGETAVGDTSEEITQIVITGIPAGSTIGAGTVPGATIDRSTPGQITVTGTSETAIRDAVKTLTIIPPLHSDNNIPLGVAVTVLDTDPDNAGSNATQTFNGTHTIAVAAVADAAVLTGSGVGFEDQSIPVTMNVTRPDDGDGSESIKEVVISGVPAGFTLTESSALAGVLTNNGGGTYTVTGPNDAAINDLLANLTLTIAASTNPRTHLDTDFNLSVNVTTRENNPTEPGVSEVARLENTQNFTVPVTVHAVADAVTHSGSSVIVEDVMRPSPIGQDIVFTKIDQDGSESVTQVVVSGIPAGSTVAITTVPGSTVDQSVPGQVTITGTSEAAIRAALDTFNVQAPLHSDVDFNLTVAATTTDNTTSPNVADHTETTTWTHAVTVQAVADTPAITTTNVTGNEDTLIALNINANRSADGNTDESEVLSVRITVPQDAGSPIGTIVATGAVNNGVTITNQGGGVYLIQGPGTGTAAQEETLIDAFLTGGGLALNPRAQFAGSFTGVNGILVEAISTEQATGGQVAPGSFGGADGTSKTETVRSFIDITINPVVDTVTFANNSTIVQENNNSTSATDPVLSVPLGTRLGTTLADLDGSQSLNLTLSNIPLTASVRFGATVLTPGGSATISGVSVSMDLAGAVTVSGPNAATAITVLNTLTVRPLNDIDANFTVGISGTTTEAIGGASTAFTGSHQVIVQAVADVPNVNVGAATKPTIAEDSGFVTYPATIALNDTDGSETYQSVVVSFSTPGGGARPEVQFGTTTGVTINTAVPGQVTLTGGTTAQMQAALASLQVRPGANNGDDITVTVRATSIESNPTEDNNGAAAGMGGGVVGPEISIPTAVTTRSFTIPVDPVPDLPTLTVPPNLPGTEDTRFNLTGISMSAGTDTDGSETRFIEIDTSSFPAGTQFFSGATQHTNVIGGFLRIPEASLSNLQMQTPLNYSGTVTLSVRGVVVDASNTNTVTNFTPAQNIPVGVVPVADPTTTPSLSVGVEDNGPVAFGANINTGLSVTDTVVGGPGQGGDETLSQVEFDLPADTASRTYTISGPFTPLVTGTTAGSGTAEVTFDAGTRTYTITSTIITGAANVALLSDAQRDQAEADIRATLASFEVEMGPTHSDLDGTIAVTATALDVKDGVSSTQDTSFNHTIRIQAVADTPTISATAGAAATEDIGTIALNIDPGRSPDEDNSETLSVRITVPSDHLGPVGTITGSPTGGITLTHQGGGVYLVQLSGGTASSREAALDAFLNGGGVSFDGRNNWSGEANLTIESISTEAANGNQLAAGSFGGPDGTSKTETVATTVTVSVIPDPDRPTVKGNAVGLEDTIIPVPLNITLADKDGSETYSVRISAVIPPTTRIFGASGEIFPDGGGFYNLTPADVNALSVEPPQHYSTALSGPIQITVETTVTDTAGATSLQQTFTDVIPVIVQGVADKPLNPAISVSADEDQPINLGAGILAAVSGDLNNARVDNDGSEQIGIILEGVPPGVVPTSAVPGGVVFIGSGTWQISTSALATLTLPPVANFSGTNPYGTLEVKAVSQEVDGDQATSDPWPITIDVAPIIDNATVDGFASWGANVQTTEDTDISLANVTNNTLRDDDGSEQVISYTFDFNAIVADAQIGAVVSDAATFIANFVNGSFTNNGDGTITVTPAQAAGLSLDRAAFVDSNVDFSIPVSALVRDTAVLSSGTQTVDKVESTNYAVDLVGDADQPTVFANSVSGNAATRIPITLGGDTIDTDVALGRAQSEDVYYVVSTQDLGGIPVYGFVDSSGNIVGLDNGDGTWVLRPGDLGDLHVLTPPGSNGTAQLTLTTIVVEDDGDTNQNATPFTVTVNDVGGPGIDPPPLPPEVTVGVSSGNEDGAIVLNVTATPAPGDPTTPSVTVLISNLPVGTEVIGATYNPTTMRWVASAAAVNSGNVQIIPPPDFSGTLTMDIEAVAINAALQKASSALPGVGVEVDPVADGVVIAATPDAAIEDSPVNLNISLTERDIDGSETVETNSYVRLNSGATLVGGYALVTGGDADASVHGTSVVGYYRVPTADLATLQMQSALNLHGDVTVDVVTVTQEPADDNDGDKFIVDQASFTVPVIADADAPSTTVGGPYSGAEDSAISLAGINADLVDTDGSEVLSVIISGVPQGSLFNAGSNNGDGSWTIPKSALDAGTLTITPPLHYAGTMNLAIEAFSLEQSNGNTDTTVTPFTVTVDPVADDVEILARDVAIDGSSQVDLDLNIRMVDDRGTEPGEEAPETIEITFSSVPAGVSLLAGSGGLIEDLGGNQWRFTGTEAQSNDLQLMASSQSTAGTYVVGLSAVTIDGADRLPVAVTDTFELDVPTVVTGNGSANSLNGGAGTQLLYGLGGIDTLNGGAGDDYLSGGTGADVLTGGADADTFGWDPADLDGSVDQITDFNAAEGDILDVSQLLVGFDPGTSVLSEFLQISGSGTVTLSIDVDGAANGVSFQDFASFANGGTSLEDLRTNGNLIV